MPSNFVNPPSANLNEFLRKNGNNTAHIAIGAYAPQDDGATTGPLFETNAGAATVLTVEEPSTTSEGVNGLFLKVTNNPASIPTSTSPYGAVIDVEYNADGTTGNTAQLGPTGAVVTVNVNSNEVGDKTSAYGLFTQVNNNGNAPIGIMSSIYTNDSTSGTGDLTAEYNGLNQNFYQGSSGTTAEVCGVAVGVDAAAGTVALYQGVKVFGPNMIGGAVTRSYGVWIEECAGNDPENPIVTAYQIYSDGKSPSFFAGPLSASQFGASTIYSAAGTPLPAATTALKGTRAVVSDATTPTFLGAYVSGGAVVAPVLCNGTTWVTA